MNPYERIGATLDNRFSFEPETHTYLHDGKPMTGTTTVLKSVKNADALLGWAANCAVDHIVSSLGPGREIADDIVFDDARKAYLQVRDKRKDEGTDLHAVVEKYIRGKMGGTKGETDGIDKFVEWADENKVTFIGSEVPVHYIPGFVGGIIDFIFEKDGKVYLGDIKTNKKPRYGPSIYPSYFYQLASYRNCVESMGGSVDGYAVCRINKSDFEVAFDKPGQYEIDRAAFLGALEVYRANRFHETSYQVTTKIIRL